MSQQQQDQISELYMALAEHQAYKECIQFEGDECGTCDQIYAEIERAKDLSDNPVAESSQGDQMQDDWNLPF